MASGRKKGASKAKGKKQLSLGDFVLAKVKGHPFWPAKISQPEDWDKAPDPKKYFVEFFGTEEMFVKRNDTIKSFNLEAKPVQSVAQGVVVHFGYWTVWRNQDYQ